MALDRITRGRGAKAREQLEKWPRKHILSFSRTFQKKEGAFTSQKRVNGGVLISYGEFENCLQENGLFHFSPTYFHTCPYLRFGIPIPQKFTFLD